MSTPTEINDFKASILYKQCTIGDIIINILSINGRIEAEEYLTKYNLINMYSNIILEYLSESNYALYNFFTVDEFYEILRNFNTLCDSDYTISL